MRLSVLLACLLCPPLAWAGSVVFNFGGTPVTLTTNANQDAKLQRLRDNENQHRASAVPPLAPLTLEQYAQKICADAYKELNQAAVAMESTDYCTQFATFSQADKDVIIAQGGGNSPCP